MKKERKIVYVILVLTMCCLASVRVDGARFTDQEREAVGKVSRTYWIEMI